VSTFPVTSVTLIAKIRNLAPGEDSAAWVRFWNSYSDAIRQFAALKGGEENADDIVMTVLGKLVDVLRNGQYTPEKGKFHSYLATMIVNEVHMSHRREIARASDRKVSIDSSVPGGAAESSDRTIADTIAAPEVSPEQLDADWREAVLKSAVEHVLTKTLVSDLNKNLYRAYVLEERPIDEVVRLFGVTRNQVSQAKTRIGRMVAAIEGV
jgi:RNA polymerase sigma factor (sigma-70 family)